MGRKIEVVCSKECAYHVKDKRYKHTWTYNENMTKTDSWREVKSLSFTKIFTKPIILQAIVLDDGNKLDTIE